MISTEVTSLSSKGQIVIPDRIRKQMGLKNGSKLIVITDGTNLLLKPIEEPNMESFKKLIEESRKFAKKEKLKKSDIKKAVEEARRENRS
jgi:AbrB family looped-hinge helix DNA binding protein